MVPLLLCQEEITQSENTCRATPKKDTGNENIKFQSCSRPLLLILDIILDISADVTCYRNFDFSHAYITRSYLTYFVHF